jgi:hypothetical protein
VWSRLSYPPRGATFARTPWLCAYRAVRTVALDGAHKGNDATAFVNVVPRATSRSFVRGMTASVSAV